MHYYQYNIGDYRRDTSHLYLLEHGVYRQLLDMYYLSESPIPKETQMVMRRLSARTQEEQNAVLFVLSEFFIELEDGWYQKKCEEIIEKFQSNAKNSKENGKLGGRPKNNPGVKSGLSKKTHTKPNSVTNKPINSSLKEKDKKEIAFDDFWDAYPKKTGKHQALKSWNKIHPDIDKIMKALSWQTKLRQWSEKQFIPNPSTYLNQRRWEDEQTYETEKTLTKHEQATIAARSIFKGDENGFENARVIEHEPTTKLLD